MRALALALLLTALQAVAAPPCTECHAEAARSYALAKHGVLARLQPGRTPVCADCHPREARTAPAHYANDAERGKARAEASALCGRCHAPRYVAEQLAAAGRGRALGEMKVAEAEGVLAAARAELSPEALARLEAMVARMRKLSLVNLRLGLAHQSPDYQWWHGQAALDGDLLRVKGALGDARRSLDGAGGQK